MINCYSILIFFYIFCVTSAEDPRIVGGQKVADRKYFAYQVSLRYKNGHFCGGTILDEFHVITAAHCCFDKNKILAAKHLTVVVGDLDLYSPTNTTQRRKVKYVFTHKKYNPSSLVNDIAILRINESFTLNDNVKPVNLSRELPKSGTPCITSGWGKHDENSEIVSRQLYWLKTPILDTTDCSKAYKFGVKKGMFCAGYMKGGKDSCQGDSGGPIVCDMMLTGIISWGDGCARENRPGVYTDVSEYLNWIDEEKLRSSSELILPSLIVLLFIVAVPNMILF